MDSIRESLEQSVAWLAFKATTQQWLDNHWKKNYNIPNFHNSP